MEQPVLHPRITANELPLGMSANGPKRTRRSANAAAAFRGEARSLTRNVLDNLLD